MLLALATATNAPAIATNPWQTWDTSRVAREGGYPVFSVAGRPFFVYGAAFFYERIPPEHWRDALLSYRRIGINTIDLYAIWNWHEPQEGAFDFDGHSNPRRNLIEVLRLCHELGLRIVLRPGPVIRNEWRNGGYPDWLLERSEYAMPLHDILEGRYPATATLQNARADAAAAEWQANATHLHYASVWLRRVLEAASPYAHDIVAIALDDDQGAYIDNDTWPAPHWHGYIGWLASQVRAVTGDRLPLFINSYDMKVTAAAPVWVWGDWYQSDAFAIGEHDRAQIGFSTGLLQTQAGAPTMVAEFQAGWLQGAGESAPRAADPSNTELALNEMLALGTHGIVNFPLQDTVYPSGWEAPWANWSYAWDAAFGMDGTNPRYVPSARFGAIVAAFGSELARTHVTAQAAIVWPASLYVPEQLTNADFAAMQTATMAAQQACRARGLACDTIDLRFAPPAIIARYPQIVLPALNLPDAAQIAAPSQRLLNQLAKRDVLLNAVAQISGRSPVEGLPGAVLLAGNAPGDPSFVEIVNWSDVRLHARNVKVRLPSGVRSTIASVDVPARSSGMIRVAPNGKNQLIMPSVPEPPRASPMDASAFTFATGVWSVNVPPHREGDALAFAQDVLHDGSDQIVMQNDRVRLVFSPQAGARAFVLQARTHGSWGLNLASSTGLLRDDVVSPATPSPRDYIAAYTHPFPAGTFNRAYQCDILSAGGARAEVRCAYDAPDIPSGGGRFERTLMLDANSGEVRVTESLIAKDSAEGLVSISAFDCRNAAACSGSIRHMNGVSATQSPGAGVVSVRFENGGSFAIGVGE